MNYYNLKSVVAAAKKPFQVKNPTDSFFIAGKRSEPYIQPTFTKVEFKAERPPVLLVSAVGVTGKSTLAQVLSFETGLPLLDLAKHKPVGADTLVGLLSNAFDVKDLSAVFQEIGNGSFGVIIDGLDEGRSKTTEKAFEAFLDDIIRLCSNPSNTAFVLLGRTQILEHCWLYLSDKGMSPALLTIAPFSLENAKNYIDAYTGALKSSHVKEYEEVRDKILTRLGTAFVSDPKNYSEDFLSFIGYPPVLDSIVTLLGETRNYFSLLEMLDGSESEDVEISLLQRIAQYILMREKEQKVIPNILTPLLEDIPHETRSAIQKSAFEIDEQCMRLVAHCLGQPLNLDRIAVRPINEKYEAQLLSWLPEHPFISGNKFRNAVFESLSLAVLMCAKDQRCVDLLRKYAAAHKSNYHLVYLLSVIAKGRTVPIQYLQILLGSALEFRSTSTSVAQYVNGADIDGDRTEIAKAESIEIEIDILLGKTRDKKKSFAFQSCASDSETIRIGQHISGLFMSVPCDVLIYGDPEIEITAPVEISARRITLEGKGLVLWSEHDGGIEQGVIVEAQIIESTLEKISTNKIPITFTVSDISKMTYPLIQYSRAMVKLPTDSMLRQRYLRLKRILMEFRSHSRGTLAKYKNKIDHERVLRNDIGKAVLARLLKDGILTASGEFYYLHPEQIDRHLGVSWIDLRKGHSGDKLVEYLGSI